MKLFWVVGVGLFLLGAPLRAMDVSALMDQGKAQCDKGDYNRALQTFLKLKKEDPANPMAREYISKCTGKIMEAEKAARVKHSVLVGEPSSTTFAPKDVPPAWAVPTAKPLPKSTRGGGGSDLKKRAGRSGPLVPNAVLEKEKKTSRYILKRDQLTKSYTNKILEGRAIDLVRKGQRVEIVVFMNRLFLPFSDSFAPDAVPAIEMISREIRDNPGKTTVFRAVDSLTPAVRHQMLDLPTRRVSILFSTLLHASLGDKANEERGTFTAADLDD